jgi:hypothetical protein
VRSRAGVGKSSLSASSSCAVVEMTLGIFRGNRGLPGRSFSGGFADAPQIMSLNYKENTVFDVRRFSKRATHRHLALTKNMAQPLHSFEGEVKKDDEKKEKRIL